MRAEAIESVRHCTRGAGLPASCLRSARGRCETKAAGGASVDAMIRASCAWLENEGWEAMRLEREGELEAALAKDGTALASAKAARAAWETYRDRWCDAEGRTAIVAATGERMVARETCRTDFVYDRLTRIGLMRFRVSD